MSHRHQVSAAVEAALPISDEALHRYAEIYWNNPAICGAMSFQAFLPRAEAVIGSLLYVDDNEVQVHLCQPLLPKQRAVADRVLLEELSASADDSPIAERLLARGPREKQLRPVTLRAGRLVEPLVHRAHEHHHARPARRIVAMLRGLGKRNSRRVA